VILLCFVGLLAAFSLQGCSGEKVEIDAPVHIEIPENGIDGLQDEMGPSGFILGTIIVFNAYIIMVLSILLLVIKDQAYAALQEILKSVTRLIAPDIADDNRFFRAIALVSVAEARQRYALAGLLGGVVLAYLGALIAL
jgi:type IV secretory pathway VirB3-like protein